MRNNPEALKGPWAWLFALLLLGAFLAVAQVHRKIIVHPWPLIVTEGAMMTSTELMLQGRNPYGFDSRPASANVYGVLGPLAALPFARALGQNSLLAHRLASALFIFMSAMLIYGMARRCGAGAAFAGLAAVSFYSQQLYSAEALARPDALGMLLFLCSLYLALLPEKGRGALLGSALFGCLAFFAKQYFLLALPFSFFWLLGRGRVGDAFFYLGAAAAFAAALVGAAAALMPAYFYEVFLVNIADGSYVLEHMVRQLKAMAFSYQPGLALALAAALGFPASARTEREAEFRGGMGFFALAGLLAFCLVVGGHTGNFGTYFVQLVLPFLTCYLASAFAGKKALALGSLALALNLGPALKETPLLDEASRAKNNAQWELVSKLIDGRRGVLASGDFSALLVKRGLEWQDDGQSYYYPRFGGPKLARLNRLFPRQAELAALAAEYQKGLQARIRQKSFGLVLAASNEDAWRAELEKGYQMAGMLSLESYNSGFRKIEIWVPR